ncbi:hypothetical protein EMN47_19475 [Prolixibacteraceae bacterium JC049]|nr:hypothetical protein [Prolixibacteraceae bacterium JC049]
MKFISTLALCLLFWQLGAQTYRLENQFTAREVVILQGHLVTQSVTNKLTNQTFKTEGNEFSLKVDGIPYLITSANCKAQLLESDSNQLVFELTTSELKDVTLQLTYTLQKNVFFGHKWLTITPKNEAIVPISKLAVEDLQFKTTSECNSQGKGQPVYLNDCFFGLEWPVAQNSFSNNQLICAHHPGKNIKVQYQSKKVVWGVAPKKKVAQWFLERYVNTIRISPVKPTVLYNSWYDVRELNPTVLADFNNTIQTFNTKLEKEQGIKVDFFVPDDGWQNRNSIYQSSHPKAHMQLRDMVEKQLDNANLGIWMPVHGCRAFDMNWVRKNGYAVANPKLWGSATMCLSMPKYRTELEKRLKELIVDERVTYFKHDNNNMFCSNTEHGHRPNSDSQVEEMFEIMYYMKKLNPDVYLNYTTGMNMSPWWLMGCDCIWMGGGDVGAAGIGNKREQAITYRDTRMRMNQSNQFPMNSLMTHGIIKGRYMMGFQQESFRNWKNYIWMFVSRGVSMFELYLTPSYLSDKEWDFLGETLRWTIDRSDIIFNNTQFILGDVRKQEPYGYSHTKGNKMILFLRNPSDNIEYDHENGIKLTKWKRQQATSAFPKSVTQVQFNDSDWKEITLGNVEQTTATHLAYRNHFNNKEEWKGKTLRIHFGGVDEQSKIYLNGKQIGAHKGCIGVIDPQTTEEMLNNWHYDYKGYYKYNASGFHIDIEADELLKQNVLTVTLNNTGKVAGVYDYVKITPIEKVKKVSAKLKLDPFQLGFDSKYQKAEIKWVHHESARTEKEVKVGETIELPMKGFEVNVLEINLK